MNYPVLTGITEKNMIFLIYSLYNRSVEVFTEKEEKSGIITIIKYEATADAALVEEEGIHGLYWPFDEGPLPSDQTAGDLLSH